MAKSNRNGAIDFFRFYFCIMIVLRHSAHALPDGFYEIMSGGALGVEFFFIVSGYLLACSAFKRTSGDIPVSVASDTNTFMKRKAGSLLPELIVASVISMTCYSITILPQGFGAILRFFAAKIWNPLLLSAAGIGVTTELWYLSAMILVMLVYYPIMIKHFNSFVRIIAPLIAIFTLGYISKGLHSLTNPSYFTGLMNKGTVRAFGEIALGVAIFPIIQSLSRQSFSAITKRLITLATFVCVAGATLIMALRSTYKFDFLCLLFLTLIVIFAFSHQGALADKFDNKFCFWLGKLSLTLYLSHRWVADCLLNIYKPFAKRNWFGLGTSEAYDFWVMHLVYFACVIIACTVVYLISKFISNHSEQIKARFKKAFIAGEAE